jgi:hypothetical protein
MQLAFAGAPPHEIAMVWLKPPIGVNVTVYDVLCPGLTLFEAGETASEKSGPAFTVCVSTVESLVAKLAFPRYNAVMEWEPCARVAMVIAACALEFSCTTPIWVAVSRKTTVPVGVCMELVTVAVKVTDWPTLEGLREELSVVFVNVPT